MNALVGTSYRTYWWRHRWMDLVVDAWTWGFAGVNANSDVAFFRERWNPPYDQWPALCSAKLHDWIDLTGGADPLTIASLASPSRPHSG